MVWEPRYWRRSLANLDNRLIEVVWTQRYWRRVLAKLACSLSAGAGLRIGNVIVEVDGCVALP